MSQETDNDFTEHQVKLLKKFCNHCADEIEKDIAKVKSTTTRCSEPWTKMELMGLAMDQKSLVDWLREFPFQNSDGKRYA